MFLYRTNCSEVCSTIESLENKFSSGDDEVHNVIVKRTSNITVPYITDLINQSSSQGVFPDIIINAKVTPVHKKGSKTDADNYRPTSFFNVWSKIFERVMHNRLYSYFKKFEFFHDKQFRYSKETLYC